MSASFQRQTLVDQVAASVEARVQAGEWRERLPSERVLCAQMSVSRATLRAALTILLGKGLLKSVPRQGILTRPHAGRARAPSGLRTVGVVTSELPSLLPPQSQGLIRGIEHYLHAAGFEMVIQTVAPSRDGLASRRLDELVSRHRAASWALCSVNKAAQNYFARRRLPALVLGSCFPGIALPELDVAYRAVCRHAAATLLRMGHRRLALVTLKDGFAGDRLGEKGFQEACARQRAPNTAAQVVYHDGTPANLRRSVESVLSGPHPPTAFIVARAQHALALAGHIQQKGLHIPGDVSLICRDDEDYLGWCVPPMARYHVDVDLYARRSARALIRLAKGGVRRLPLPPIMPRYMPGATVAPPRFLV